jgi:hypothetical protein
VALEATGEEVAFLAFLRVLNAFSASGGDGKAPDIIMADDFSFLSEYFFLTLPRFRELWTKSSDMIIDDCEMCVSCR